MQISDILQSFSIFFSFAELELRKLAKLMPPSLGATDRSVLQLTDVDACRDIRLSVEEIGATWLTVSFPVDQFMAQGTKGALLCYSVIVLPFLLKQQAKENGHCARVAQTCTCMVDHTATVTADSILIRLGSHDPDNEVHVCYVWFPVN